MVRVRVENPVLPSVGHVPVSVSVEVLQTAGRSHLPLITSWPVGQAQMPEIGFKTCPSMEQVHEE
jgi:hypothetical protein